MFYLQADTKKITVLSNIQINIPCKSVSEPPSKLSDEPLAKKPRTENLCNDVSVQTEQRGVSKENLQQKVKVLTQKLRRRANRIHDLKSLLNILKKRCKNFNEVEGMIKNNFIDIHKYLYKDKSNKGNRYSEEIKKFALSLYYYSPRAYMFLRSYIALPHPATLRKILATNDCNVGFMQEVLEFLKSYVQNDDSIKNVALMFDAMHIRSEVKEDKKTGKYWGYTDYGGIVPVTAEEWATEVLVVEIVSLKSRFKCPIGYFFINKISANVQAQLVLTAIRLLSDINIIVRSLTCDGTTSNISTYQSLGCDFSLSEMRTHFKHPTRGLKIYCIFDPPHMLKLCRNILAETNLSSDKGEIKFRYVQDLHQIQEEEGLRFANKLCNAHVNFFNKKMNVRLATQLISSSVADAIDFLRQSGNPKFIGSEATVQYIRMLDRLFDLMNCKNPMGSGFKSPMRLENKEFWINVFNETKDYLLTLKIDEKNVLGHRRKTGVLGLIVNTISFQNLALDLLQSNECKYFLTYKCCQDHLEMLFSCVRARGGGNDNPNALQFRYTLRRLLFKNSITPSINANCTVDDYESTPVLEFRSEKRTIVESNNEDNTEKSVEVLLNLIDNSNLSNYKLNIIYYIGGCIVNKMIGKISCKDCCSILLVNNITDHNYCVDISQFSAFTTFVDRGRLKYVSHFVFEILKYCEKLFVTMSIESLKNIRKNKIIMYVVQEFYTKFNKMMSPPHPQLSIMSEVPHEIQLVKSLANSYLNLRFHHFTKLKSLSLSKGAVGLRQKLHKTVLFNNV